MRSITMENYLKSPEIISRINNLRRVRCLCMDGQQSSKHFLLVFRRIAMEGYGAVSERNFIAQAIALWGLSETSECLRQYLLILTQ